MYSILQNYKVILKSMRGHQTLWSPHAVICMSRILIPKLYFPDDDKMKLKYEQFHGCFADHSPRQPLPTLLTLHMLHELPNNCPPILNV